MPRLIWVFAGRTCHYVGFVMRWLILLSPTQTYGVNRISMSVENSVVSPMRTLHGSSNMYAWNTLARRRCPETSSKTTSFHITLGIRVSVQSQESVPISSDICKLALIIQYSYSYMMINTWTIISCNSEQTCWWTDLLMNRLAVY